MRAARTPISLREEDGMRCYPLTIAAHIAIAIDCIRRGDLEGAAAALARAAALSRKDDGPLPCRG
jgi:hypothetical protein